MRHQLPCSRKFRLNIPKAGWVDEILRGHAVMRCRHAITETIVLIRPGIGGADHADEPVVVVVAIGPATARDQVAIGIVSVRSRAACGVLIQVVDEVIDARACQSVPVGIVGVLNGAARQSYRRDFAVRVIAEAPRSRGSAHGGLSVQCIVGIVELAQHPAAGRMISQVQRTSIPIISIGGVSAIAQRLPRQPACAIVGVGDDQGAAASGELRKPSRRIISILDCKPGRVSHACTLTSAIVGVLNAHAAWIGNAREPVGGVVGKTRYPVCSRCRQQVAVAVIGITYLRSVGIASCSQQVLRVIGVVDGMSAPIRPACDVPVVVIGRLREAGIGVGDSG